jgi:hypothetical protein
MRSNTQASGILYGNVDGAVGQTLTIFTFETIAMLFEPCRAAMKVRLKKPLRRSS